MANLDETVYWVDEQDKILGEIPKSLAHSDNKYIHREIAIILHDSNNKILIQQRSARKKVYPLYWTISVAGHVTVGRTTEQAAHIELQEELGFDTKLIFLYKEILHDPQETIMENVFIGKYNGEKIRLQEEEVAQYKLVDQNELQLMANHGEKLEPERIKIMKRFWDNEFSLS